MAESRGITPTALESKPELPSYLSYYSEAFNFLSSRRLVFDGVEQPIQLSAMLDYLRYKPWYDTEIFVRLISVLDFEYLDYRSKNGREEISPKSGNQSDQG